jgi:hypothetical protein
LISKNLTSNPHPLIPSPAGNIIKNGVYTGWRGEYRREGDTGGEYRKSTIKTET